MRLTLAAMAVVAMLSAAHAHSFYARECCSERDCKPYAKENIEETSAGFLIKPLGEFIPRDNSKIKFSHDEDYHLCRSEVTGYVLCLYIPNSGS